MKKRRAHDSSSAKPARILYPLTLYRVDARVVIWYEVLPRLRYCVSDNGMGKEISQHHWKRLLAEALLEELKVL